MCCICGKLPLYLKCVRETFKHLIIRNAKLVQFFNFIFFYSWSCQILRLYFFNFIRKFTDWSECMPTYKICNYPANKCQYGWYQQTVFFVIFLIIICLDRKIIGKLRGAWNNVPEAWKSGDTWPFYKHLRVALLWQGGDRKRFWKSV